MPGFILDVQGLAITFKTPGGVIDVVNRVSVRLVEGKTLGATGESNNPGLAAVVIGDRDNCMISLWSGTQHGFFFKGA